MRTGRRLISALLSLLFLLSLAACSGGPENDGRPEVLATNFALYDFARAVCGEACRVEMLIPPGSESHDYELTLADAAQIEHSDLFLYVGGEGEDWIGDLREALGPSLFDSRGLSVLDCVKTLTEKELEGMQAEPGEEEEGAVDEHVWTSLGNAGAIVSALADRVIALVPLEAETVRQNRDAYLLELDTLRREMKKAAGEGEGRTLVVADRFPFRYLAEELGLSFAAAFSGCSSNVEPTLATIGQLIDITKREGLSVIFVTELSDGRTAKTVAAETGAEIRTLYACHNVTKEDFDAGVTYPDLMRRNLTALSEALGALDGKETDE